MEASALHAPVAIGRVTISAPLLRLRSDDQLVALFRAGNEEAFRVIHDRYRQRLFAYTRQMLAGSRSDAEDALQDVFLRAYSALRADARPLMLRAWLYRVAHNRCIDHLRRPVPPAAEVFDMSRGPLADPIAQAERREDLRRLVADVRELPEQQRSALLMREMEGLSYAELADALDITVPAVKSVLVRARVSLVEAIEARDTDCVEIRSDIASAIDRGVRCNGRVRRHVRECDGCQDYNTRLRGVQRSFQALSPGHGPAGFIAKVLGIGGAGSGAAAGGTAAGGGAAAVGTGAVAVTATKVAVVACCAALTAGGAIAVSSSSTTSHRSTPVHHLHHAAILAAPAAVPAPTIVSVSNSIGQHVSAPAPIHIHHAALTHVPHHVRATPPLPAPTPTPVTSMPDPATTGGAAVPGDTPTGGVRAPDDTQDDDTSTDDPAATTDPADPSSTSTSSGASSATTGDGSDAATGSSTTSGTGDSDTTGTSGDGTSGATGQAATGTSGSGSSTATGASTGIPATATPSAPSAVAASASSPTVTP
jgi:RNA polymerase sigma factor (sigma-70 family)